jgi:uncharacterized protein (TIGR02145 family)
MKRIILLFTFLIGLSTLSAEQPKVRVYIDGEEYKSYNLSDIDNIIIKNSQSYNSLRIYYQDSLTIYYPVEVIDKIVFENDAQSNELIRIFIKGFPQSYFLSGIDSIDFYQDEYQPITIGRQVWMLRNLNVDHLRNGIEIPEVQESDQWLNQKLGAWCYFDNNPEYGPIYGKLYNWYAVYDPRGLAPKGWHIASEAEWATLLKYLGGEDIAAIKLKEKGTDHWPVPNSDATNESGFTALPGGGRLDDGLFSEISETGYWWTSKMYDASRAWVRNVLSYTNLILTDYYDKVDGFSVRCVKD